MATNSQDTDNELIPLNDPPEDWQTYFGLDDNPFSPSSEHQGIQLSKLMLETMPLCPNIPGYESLYPSYFVMEVDNFAAAYGVFRERMSLLKLAGIQQGLVALIYGPTGSDKTTLANLCRSLLIRSSRLAKTPRIFQCEINMNNRRHKFQNLDDIIKILSDQLSRELSSSLPNKIVANSLEELVSESRAIGGLKLPSSLILILLDDITSNIVNTLSYKEETAFLLLSDLVQELGQFLTPVIFATTSIESMFLSLSNRELGSRIEAAGLKLGELSGDDVVKYVDERLKTFRSKDHKPPSDIPLFPFKAEIIRECFGDLKEDRQSGSLPFRNINRILASALRVKKESFSSLYRYKIPYKADLESTDIEFRIVDKACLDTAIKHVKEYLP